VTLQYSFNPCIIAYAKTLGFEAEPHEGNDGWWRYRRINAVIWYNAPMHDALDHMVEIRNRSNG